MSKLLQTNLPLAQGVEITPELFNRLVRILEINLSAVDPDKSKEAVRRVYPNPFWILSFSTCNN